MIGPQYLESGNVVGPLNEPSTQVQSVPNERMDLDLLGLVIQQGTQVHNLYVEILF